MTACPVQVVGPRPRRSPVLPADTSTCRPGWSVQAKRQQRQRSSWITAIAVGVDHGLSRERVAKVVQTRAGTGPRRQTSVLHHLVKCTSSGVLVDRGAFLRDEQGILGSGAKPAPGRDAEITGQRVTRTRLEPDHALTPELRVSDQDDSLVQIDIADREPDGFPNAHSRNREQPDQSRHRCRTQWGEQLVSCRHQSPDVVERVQIWRCSAGSADSLTDGGHAHWQAGASEVDRELSDGRQPGGQPSRVSSDGCVCPRQRFTLGEQQAIVTFGRKSGGELGEQVFGLPVWPEPASRTEVHVVADQGG